MEHKMIPHDPKTQNIFLKPEVIVSKKIATCQEITMNNYSYRCFNPLMDFADYYSQALNSMR